MTHQQAIDTDTTPLPLANHTDMIQQKSHSFEWLLFG